MYFSLVPKPGYNISFLETLGIGGEWDLFVGDFLNDNNVTVGTWGWGNLNHSIEGKLEFLVQNENN